MSWGRKSAGSISGLTELGAFISSDTVRHLVSVYQDLLIGSDGSLPTKADFDPFILRKYLANTILYDVTDPSHVVFRIVGETMKSHFKINPVGQCYLDFVPEERRSHALAAFRHCAEMPCAMLSRTRQVFASGLARYCEAVGVPLMGADPTMPATHLLFVDSPVKLERQESLDKSPFRFANLLERYFVDVGHGVPGPFEDLILKGIPNPFEEMRPKTTS